jgi:DNA-binding NarL/FixJ family response regulator
MSNPPVSTPSTVLLVDTDGIGVAEHRAVLAAANFSLLEARSPIEALALASTGNVALAVLYHNGGCAGALSLAGTLFEKHRIHSMFVSAHSAGPAPEDLAAVGAIGYLPRSVAGEDFVRAMHAALSRAAELAQLRLNEERMRSALLAERAINTAIGILMERLQLSREAAFSRLRAYARSHRVRIVDVSRSLAGCDAEKQRIMACLANEPPT